MIKNVSIKNFKSIRDQDIKNLPNIVGLWGENGTGKSSLLQAIMWAGIMRGGLNGYGLDFNSQENIIYGRNIGTECNVEIYDDQGSYIQCYIDKGGEIGENGVFLESIRYFPTWRCISSRWSTIENKVLTHLGNQAENTHNFLHWQLHKLMGNITRKNDEAKETYERLNFWATKVGFGELLDEQVSSKMVMGTYKDPIFDLEVPIVDGGFGGNSFLPILLVCYSLQDGIILIEEPEISLHPGAQGDIWEFMMEMAEKRNHQIIFTSHSPYLATKMARTLNEGNFKDKIRIYFTTKEKEKGTIFKHITEDELTERFRNYWDDIFPEMRGR